MIMYKDYLERHLYLDKSLEEIRLELFVKKYDLDANLANELLDFYTINQIKELIIIPDFYFRIEEYVKPTLSSSAIAFIRDLVFHDLDPCLYFSDILDDLEIRMLRRKLKLKNLFTLITKDNEDINDDLIEDETEKTQDEDIDFDDFDNFFSFLEGSSSIDLDEIFEVPKEEPRITTEEFYFEESSLKYLDFLYNIILDNAILINPKDEKSVFDSIHDRNQYERFFNGNTRLAVKYAFNYAFIFKHLQQDFIQQGFLGVINAMDRFDSSKGFKFSTFAVNHIKQQISRFAQDYQSTIRIPVHKREELYQTSRFINNFKIDNLFEPTTIILSEELQKSVEEIEGDLQLIDLSNNFSDLSMFEMKELIEQINYNPTEEYVYKSTLRKDIRGILEENLTERECFVVMNRFGMNENEKSHTLEELGEIIGVTRERIRQIEAKAIRKLNKNNILEEFFDIMNEQQSGDKNWINGLNQY